MTKPDRSETAAPAVGTPLDGGVGPAASAAKPRAWAIFVDNGNARMWSTLQPHVQKFADAEGLEVVPLYDQAALDAAVAAERERVVAAIRDAHDSGNSTGIERDVYIWNRAVAHCLRRVLGPNGPGKPPGGSA